MQVVVKLANTSGNLKVQYLERKELLPLDNMSREQRKKYRQRSVASLKKNRKVSIQRLERRARRDIQFGRKVAEKPTDIDLDEGVDENDFDFTDDIEAPEGPESPPRKPGRVKPARVTRAKPTKTAEAPAEKATRPEKEKATPPPKKQPQVKEQVRKEDVPYKARSAEKPEKKKSFSKVDKGDVKLKKSEVRYANSFREKKPFENEYSKTSSFSMDMRKGVRKPSADRTADYKNDTSYNDKNDPKPFTGRLKTKFGKVVGKKSSSKVSWNRDSDLNSEKPKSAGRKKSDFLRRSPK